MLTDPRSLLRRSALALACLGLLPAAAAAQQPPVQTVDEALGRLEDGLELSPSLSRDLAEEALDRLAIAAPEEIGPLADIARRGADEVAVTRALLDMIASRPDSAVEALLAIEPGGLEGCEALLLAEGAAWQMPLLDVVQTPAEEWAEGEAEAADRAAGVAADILGHRLAPQEVGFYAGDWSDSPELVSRAGRLLRAAGKHGPSPADLFDILVEMSFPEELTYALGLTLGDLVARDEVAAQAAVDRADVLRSSASPALVRCLGKLPPEHWDIAVELLTELLEGVDPQLPGESYETRFLIALTRSSADLLVPELLTVLPGLLLRGPTSEARAAAALAFGKVGYRDEFTMSLLVGALDSDPVVAGAAYDSLLRKSGTELPMRPRSWRSWLHSTPLPEAPPLPAEERLANERRALAILRRHGVNRDRD